MAPQATLTFTPSVPASTLRDPFDLNSLGSFASFWPFRERERPQSDSPVPLEPSHSAPPVPPTLAVTGPFSLLRGGAIQVGQVRVGIERGTFVGRCSGLGEMGTESRGLWWIGIGTRGEKGVWILQLLRATDGDAIAVHRLLLYLPPRPFVSQPLSPSASHSPVPYRNSLLLYDDQTRQIVSILPLEDDSSPHRCRTRGRLPPLPDSVPFSKPLPLPPSPPSPTTLSPGAKLAQYVDRVVQGIHPDPTPEALSATDRLEQARIRRQASREERDWDPFMLAEVLLAPPTASTSGTSTSQDQDETVVDKNEEEEGERNQESTMLPASASIRSPSTQSRRSLSAASLSSFATFGTERFVTADEFDQEDDEEEDEASRMSSYASMIAEGSHFIDPALPQSSNKELDLSKGSSVQTDEDVTPTPSTFVDPSVDESPQSSNAMALDSTHTLTNGNAVLLSFLGGPSIISPSSTTSPSTRVKVSTHPLSEAQVSEQLDLGTIRPAEVEIEKGEEARGWLNWLSSLLNPVGTGSQGEGEPRGWLSWIVWPWSVDPSTGMSSKEAALSPERKSLSASTFTTSTASSLSLSPTLCLSSSSSARTPARRLGRAQGETTSRLSVLYVDGEGRGSRVYVA